MLSRQSSAPADAEMLGLEARNLLQRRLAIGDILFRQGDRAEHIFFVEEGRLRLERQLPDGRRIVQQTARAGEFFAEASLFAERYHCDAVARRATIVRIYPRKLVLAAVAADPVGAEGLLASLARQVQQLRHLAEIRRRRGARDRVLMYLEMISDPQGSAVLHDQLQDIAEDLGLTREALYRTLSAMERDGLLAREGSSIKLL